jgi:hypothetical protein
MLVLMAVFVPGIADAKRTRAPKVEPVVHEGVRYIAPNDEGRRAYVQAWDTKTNKIVWEVTIFRNLINPLKEEDVQWLFIKEMLIHDGKLIVIAEGNRVYSLDLKTQAVKRLKESPPQKPQANRVGGGIAPPASHTTVHAGGWRVGLLPPQELGIAEKPVGVGFFGADGQVLEGTSLS